MWYYLAELVVLNVPQPPNKPTLDYPNQHRPAAFFEEFFWNALQRFRPRQRLSTRPTYFPIRDLAAFTGYHDHLPSRRGARQCPCAAQSHYLLGYRLITAVRCHDPNGGFLSARSCFRSGHQLRVRWLCPPRQVDGRRRLLCHAPQGRRPLLRG